MASKTFSSTLNGAFFNFAGLAKRLFFAFSKATLSKGTFQQTAL